MVCRDHLYQWCRPGTRSTELLRRKDLRRFGRWQWGEGDEGVVLAFLLDLPAADVAAVIEAFDRAESKTARHPARKRRLHHLRGALRFAHEREGTDAPNIRPAVRTAA